MRTVLLVMLMLAVAATVTLGQLEDEGPQPRWKPEPGDLDPAVNLALGKVVSFSPQPNYSLTKAGDTDATDLTDGVLCDHPEGLLWWQSKCVGYSYGGRANLSLDLGKIEPIDEIAIRFQGGSPQGSITGPVWMAPMVSDDGQSWRQVGEYTTFGRDDSVAFGVPRHEGEAFVHRYRFSNLNTRGRYVGLAFYCSRAQYSDEMYVMAGKHDPNAVDMSAWPLVDFSTSRPQMHLHKPYLCFTTNIVTENPVGLTAPEDMEPEQVLIRLELPPGVRLVDGSGFGRGTRARPAPPLSTIEPTPIEEGWNRYEWDGNTVKSTKTWGRLFIGGDWPDGTEGTMRYQVVYADGTEAVMTSVPIRAIEVPQTPQPRELLVGLSWYDFDSMLSWPDSLNAFRTLGFNTVSSLLNWTRSAEGIDEGPLAELWEQARAEGFKLMHIDATLHYMAREDEAHCELPDGTVGDKFCPSYRGPLYQWELDRLAQICAKTRPDYVFPDIELWSWQGPVDARQCKRCQQDFANSGMDSFEQWQLQKGYEMWTEVVDSVRAACAEVGAEAPQFGVYGWRTTADYQYTWPVSRFYPEYLQSVQPSSYNPLGWSDLINLGNRIRTERATLQGPHVIPWLSPGDGGTFDGERFRYALLECFCNGASGLNFWSDRTWDSELLAAYSHAIRNLVPAEDLILSGELLDGATVDGPGRISGVVADGQMLLLVADYYLDSDGAVSVKLPVAGAMTATDLDSGETLSVAADGSLQVPVQDGNRARILHVK